MSLSTSRRRLLAAGTVLLAAPGIVRAQVPVLRVGNQKGGLRSLLEASGAGKDLPYRIEWSEFPAAAPLLEALNAGALDVGYQGDLAFLSAYAAGAPLRAVGASRAAPACQAILVRDGAYRQLADLKGKRIAGNRGGWGHYLIRAALKRDNIRPDEVTINFMPPTDALLAFRSGAVDAWAVWEPYISVEELQFDARRLLDAQGLSPSVTFVSASEAAIRDKRPQLTDFLRRFGQGWEWANGHIPDYARYNSTLTRIPEAALRKAYELQAAVAVPIDAPLVREIQDAADHAVEFGLMQRRVEVAGALDLSFVAPAAASRG